MLARFGIKPRRFATSVRDPKKNPMPSMPVFIRSRVAIIITRTLPICSPFVTVTATMSTIGIILKVSAAQRSTISDGSPMGARLNCSSVPRLDSSLTTRWTVCNPTRATKTATSATTFSGSSTITPETPQGVFPLMSDGTAIAMRITIMASDAA